MCLDVSFLGESAPCAHLEPVISLVPDGSAAHTSVETCCLPQFSLPSKGFLSQQGNNTDCQPFLS